MQVYKEAIKRVKDQLLDARGLYARYVIVTSDDMSPMFQASVKRMCVNHSELFEGRG